MKKKKSENVLYFNSRRLNQINQKKETIASVIAEIKRVLSLSSVQNLDPNCVSLYQLNEVNEIKRKEYNRIKNAYHTLLDRFFKTIEKNNKLTKYILQMVTYNLLSERLEVSYKIKESDRVELKTAHIFITNDGLLNITNLPYQEILITESSVQLIQLHNDLKNIIDFICPSQSEIIPVNSSFTIYYHPYGIRISNLYPPNSLCYSDCDYQSHEIWHYSSGKKQEELFKKIYVNIDDCPTWSKEVLYKMRKQELERDKSTIKRKVLVQRKTNKR